MKIIKIGRIELTETEAQRIYESGRKYLVTSTRIYEVRYSVNAGYYGTQIYYDGKTRFCKPGRFYKFSASEVNNILGFTLLVA